MCCNSPGLTEIYLLYIPESGEVVIAFGVLGIVPTTEKLP